VDQLMIAVATDPGMQQIIRILEGLRSLLVGVLATLAVVALTYAGVRYVIAGGDPAGVEKAKGAVKSAVVGFGLALLAPLLIALVKHVLGG
jgi:hypothetical protein